MEDIKKTKLPNKRKSKLIVCAVVLLAMIIALLPMIYKKVYSYYCGGQYNADTVTIIMLIFPLLFSWWLWFMGLSTKNWLKGIPLFIGGTALILVAYFLSTEDGNANWKYAQYFIVFSWTMLHLEYCLSISTKIRKKVSATILFLGIPVTCLAILWSDLGSTFNSGMPAWKGVVFFPAIILGPFLFLFLVRNFICYSQKESTPSILDSNPEIEQ